MRKRNGYSLENLAQLTGFTKGYLSKIERSPKSPPFATVQTIAEALKVDLVELLEGHPDGQGSKNIDIANQASPMPDDWEAASAVYSFKPLLNKYKDKYMSPFLFRIKKGVTDMNTHDSEEFVYVLEGRVDLNYEGRKYELRPGDCFYLDSRIKHNFANAEDKTALLLAVHFNYRKF